MTRSNFLRWSFNDQYRVLGEEENLAAESSAMAPQRKRCTGKFPPAGPADWIADGHVTCNIQCSGGKCDRRMVDVRLDTRPQGFALVDNRPAPCLQEMRHRRFCEHRAELA
jgi:hypothetical protein